MKKLKTRALIVLLGMMIISVGCKMAASPSVPVTQAINPAYTSAAETIIAQLTQVAQPATVTPGPTVPVIASQTPPPATLSTESPSPIVPTIPLTTTTTQEPVGSTTPTAEKTEVTAQVTATLPVSSTASASADPKLNLGEPTWKDTFDDGNNWPLYQDNHVQMQVKGGALQMTALNPGKWESWMLSWPEISNFYLELTATPENCSGKDHYGLLARAPDASHAYLFSITCDGQYSFRLWDGDQFKNLIDWAASPAILTGANQTNRLGLMAEGDKFTLYANGNLLTSVNDSTHESGAFGVSISSANTPDFKVNFSEIAYWDLP